MKPRPLTWWSTRRGETIELFGRGVERCAFAYFTRIHAVVRAASVEMREQIAVCGVCAALSRSHHAATHQWPTVISRVTHRCHSR